LYLQSFTADFLL